MLWVGGNGISSNELSSDTDPLHNKGHGGLVTSQVTSHSEIWWEGAQGSTGKSLTIVYIDHKDTKVQRLLDSGSLLRSIQLDLKLFLCDCAMIKNCFKGCWRLVFFLFFLSLREFYSICCLRDDNNQYLRDKRSGQGWGKGAVGYGLSQEHFLLGRAEIL